MNAKNVRVLTLWLSIGRDRWMEDSVRVNASDKNGDVYRDREMNGKTYT